MELGFPVPLCRAGAPPQNARGGGTEELDARKAELSKRLAAKQAEKDRHVRAYAQGYISENELGAYLADAKDQLNNLRRLLDSVEGELSQKRE